MSVALCPALADKAFRRPLTVVSSVLGNLRLGVLQQDPWVKSLAKSSGSLFFSFLPLAVGSSVDLRWSSCCLLGSVGEHRMLMTKFTANEATGAQSPRLTSVSLRRLVMILICQIL